MSEEYSAPAPAPAPGPGQDAPLQEFSECAYFCFYIDQSIYDKEGFKISSSFISNLGVKEFKVDNLVVYCVHCQGLLNYAFKLFKSNYYFKISYKFKNSTIFTSNFDFIVEKNKIKFIFDAGNKGIISNPLFINPSCLEQYNAFCKVTKKHDLLFKETVTFLSNNLDMELFLNLLEEKKEERDDLMDILSNFPYLIIHYEKNKKIKDFDFSPFTEYNYYNKLILIYSIIQDSIDLITDFTEDEIYYFIQYNDTQRANPLLIQKNIFYFFSSKLTKLDDKKKLCKSVYSIPLLFEYLIGLKEEELQKINNLTINDIPNQYSSDDNLIELIEKYEKIKTIFAEKEINKVWKKYLSQWYSQKQIKDLEEVIDKLISTNEQLYSDIISEIKNEIINKGKKLIEKNMLKSLDMYKFINKYNSYGDLYSDESLLRYIGQNIILEDLNNNKDTLNEFNQCKFLNKINSKLINNYISGTLSQVITFNKLYLYFKYVYLLKKKENENEDKNFVSVKLILSHFRELLSKISRIQMDIDFKDIIYTIIALSAMYITDETNNNYYTKIIINLGNCPSFSQDELLNLFIEKIINSDIENYISSEVKDKVCEFIIKTFYFNLNTDKKIDLLSKIKSISLKEKLIYIKFPIIKFSDFLSLEENISFDYLKNFIEKKIINNGTDSNSNYFKDLISKCNSIKDMLNKESIDFSIVIQLKELIQKKKISNRIKYICLGDSKSSEELEKKINIYTNKYITYYRQLEILMTYYNKYYPNYKKDEITYYSGEQKSFIEAKKKMCDIKLKPDIEKEIEVFEKYEKSKFFVIFYNNIKNKNDTPEGIKKTENELQNQEEDRFNKAKEKFEECKIIFTEEDFSLEFFELLLNKLEDNENGDNLMKEIIYLKEFFGYKNYDEKLITANLVFYKNRKKISKALKSIQNLCQKISVGKMDKLEEQIARLADNIEEIENFSSNKECLKSLKDIDKKFLDKNFIEILNNFYEDDELLDFLNSQNESEARNLIDGLFDDENQENFSIELKDIEILINAVCFFQDIKRKTSNFNSFIDNFHFILEKKDMIYKDIFSNLVHIKIKINFLQEFIKNQLGKKAKYSTNIEQFVTKGIIKFKKNKKKQPDNSAPLNEKNEKEELCFTAVIVIGDKEENFELFKEIIRRISAKNIYKYGKNKENFLKVKKISQLIQAILNELNVDVNQEFDEVYKVSDFEFINQGILKVPKLEMILKELRKRNRQMKKEIFQKIEDNISNMFLDDINDIENKDKIENFFPDIKEIETSYKNKIVHKNFKCEICGMNPIIGIRYFCKNCKLNYCENCIKNIKENSDHEINKVDIPYESNPLSNDISNFLENSQIKEELVNNLKGIFFYRTSKDYYEIDILRFFNKLLNPEGNTKSDENMPTNLPYNFNLLLCYDNLTEEQIYAFCFRAINCSTHNLFIIVRPEELKISQEKLLFRSLNTLLENNRNKIESCILVLYINQNSHIIKQLKNLKEKCEFPDEPPIFKTIETIPLPNLEKFPVEIVTSDSPRVGKTHYILSQLDSNKYYIPFSLGDVDEQYLEKKTSSFNDDMKNNEYVYINFELYDNSNEKAYNLIKNFFFQFLILRSYRNFNYILSNNIKIFIEVSSDYTNFYENYKFLKAFKRHDIKFKNQHNFYEVNQIILDKEENNNIFKALNYLKLLKTGEINQSSNIQTEFSPGPIDADNYALIKEYFIDKFPSKDMLPNFGQIEMFSNLLTDLIYNLLNIPKIEPEEIQKYITKYPILKDIRSKIVSSYIGFVIKFTSFSYDSILKNQEEASKYQKQLGYELSVELKKELINKINQKKTISYNDIRPGIILFNKIPDKKGYVDINECSILTTYSEEDNKFKELNYFYHNYLGFLELLNLFQYDGGQFIIELKSICLTPDCNNSEIGEKIKGGYEFTIDNFVKMVLIYLRIRAKVPLILLGETGCGKTSLIEALYLFIKDRYELIKFNIHSGINYLDISKFFEENKLYDSEVDINANHKDEKNIILFLDEINTTNSLNLLCDIFVKHSFLGKKLKKNLFFIAACNPYRLMLSDTKEIGYINKKMHRIRNLAYTVNPLPLCLINYVFDFGNVKEEDEEKYIRKFMNTFLKDKFSINGEKGNDNFSKILEIIVSSVHLAQKFIRENSEISSVSLREIKRFRIFFEFFFNILKDREEFKNPDFSCIKDDSIFSEAENIENKIEDYICLKAANLSLFMCYYIRIINPKKRKELAEKIEDILKFDFLDYPLKLENELVDSLKLDKGIAKNRALLDNIFTLFVCLINKIPVFICGKAGCSKSLSFSLLYNSMKGEYSQSKLFKKYPSLYVTSYQGSLTSSSSEIKTIFSRAKKIVEASKKSLSVILFDEMGLAEISPYNPLKVIHSELDGNQEVGFVGISNWTLDASKMNRAIHLSVQEPELDDLILTAITIASDIYEEIENVPPYRNLIENLTKSYFDYKNHLKKNYTLNYDFHGARDFYHLIKVAARTLKNNRNKISLEKIAMESIERNFSGLELDKEAGNTLCLSTKIFKDFFSKNQKNFVENIDKYDIFSCIKNNLDSENNRYLLLITNKTKNEALAEFILKKLKKEYKFIQGSKLREDQHEDYVLEKAWSITSFMEKGDIIILKDLEIVYPKFYDLFNQNFQKFGNSLYARIVLDSTTNERFIVNKDFRCIVLLDQEDVNEQDPPFLNRFEKHLMSFTYLLTESQNNLAKEIYEEIKDLTTIPENKEMLPFLVNINIEEIRCLLLYYASIFPDYQDHVKDIYKLLIPTFTQENILNALFSPQKKYIKKEDLIKFYEKNSHTNIFKYLEKVENNKLIIYTFSPYYKDIFSDNIDSVYNNKKFGTISKENTIELTFNQKLSEKMLNYFFQTFYENEKHNLFVMHFKLRDSKHLKYIKYQLDEFLQANKDADNKIYLFIIHIEKNYEKKENIDKEDQLNKSVKKLESYHSYFLSFTSNYEQITIDNLLEQRQLSVTELYNKTNEELMIIKELFDVNLIIKKEFSRQILQMPQFQNKNSIIDNLDNLEINGTLNCIINKIQNSIKNSDNILRKILVNYSSLNEKDSDFLSYFMERIIMIISENVEKLIKELGKNGYLISRLFEKEIPQKLKGAIFSFINNINLSKASSFENIEESMLDLKIPGSILLFKKLSNLVKNCKIDYLNIENEYRKSSKKKKNEAAKKIALEDVHFEKKQYLKNKLWNEELLTIDIFSEYFQDILNDFIIYTFYDKNTKTYLNKKQIEFIQFLYNKKNNNENILDRFLYFCLWIGCYYETISKFLDIFNKIDKYFKPIDEEKEEDKNLTHDKQSLLDVLKDNYDLFKITNEKDKEKEAEQEKVNGIFYRISESICYVISNIHNIDLDTIDLKLFCTELNEVAQMFIQFNSSLSLGLKGQYSFLSISKLIEFAQKNKIDENEFKKTSLRNFIKNIYDEKYYLIRSNISQAKKSFDEQINITIKLSNELSAKIFVNKLLQYSKNEKYKLELVKAIFQYPQLIKFSSLFFNYIFLTEPIKPKRQTKKNISDDEKNEYLKSFGEIRNLKKNKILTIINEQAENNEILREILIYIFELRLISYFEECLNSKIMRGKDILLILTGLNRDYFQYACNEVNNSKNLEGFKNLAIIFYFSFIRCYLYYFVKMQLEYNELGDLSPMHQKLYDMSNSNLGKMLALYIAKIFILQNKKKYFLENYMKDEEINNWKNTILSQNEKELFYSIENYENSKVFLFYIWANINNNTFNKELLQKIDITDFYYMMNFAFNEINKKAKQDELSGSQLLKKLNEIKKYLNFDEATNKKLNRLIEKLTDLEFFKEEKIKNNLKPVFNMINLYILGFMGITNNSLFSSLFADKVSFLIKIFNNEELNDKLVYIESYYAMKKYLEGEYKRNNNKINFYPVYVCSCGRWYTIKDSLPTEQKDCECGLKIGGSNESLVERENHTAIYYNENHKTFVEDRLCGKISGRKCRLKGILLKEFKDEFILIRIINKCKSLDGLLLNNFNINEDTFPDIYMNYMFLSQLFIEYILSTDEERNFEEFNFDTLFNEVIELNKKIEEYITSKKISLHDFTLNSFDTLFKLFKDVDCIKNKNKITSELKLLINRLEHKNNEEKDEQIFNNIEMNILTSLTYEKDFTNENLKYLLTAAQYPSVDLLKKSISLYKKKPLPILEAFLSLDQKNSEIEKLSHIEIINDFINMFAEENRKIISRQSIETDAISFYLNEYRKNYNIAQNEKSNLDNLFENFCDSYEKITNVEPLRINQNSLVKNIINDDKVKGKETPINLLYQHLIEIQNQHLNKIIESYNKYQNEIKDDIIIKNAIEQIQKEKPIQLCTNADIFSFKVSDNIILSFEELFSFYSLKNIFNGKEDKIDYSKYSEIKFKLNMIEKKIVNLILTGKKLFSKEQIVYKFYLDPYEVEEKTKKFEIFTELYDREELTKEEETKIKTLLPTIEKIILPNLEIMIFYLINENKYQGSQRINQIKFPSNLYLDKKCIELFKDFKDFTINKLISLYEFIEDEQWNFISDRYISEDFKRKEFVSKFKSKLEQFYKDEKNRELKNDFLTSLLIKFVCRYLPYEKNQNSSDDLFEMIREKNMNLNENIQKVLKEMSTSFGAKLSDAIDITRYFVQERNNKRRAEERANQREARKEEVNENKNAKGNIININKDKEKSTTHINNNREEEEENDEDDDGADEDRDL